MKTELELVKFIKEHENWEELLAAEPYAIKVTRDAGYIIFKYNQIMSDFSNEIVKECRGLILREADFKPVCVPFYKFMNAEEQNSDLGKINWSAASVQEKIDGSLMKVWFDAGWHISTNGTIDAFKAELSSVLHNSYGALFLDAVRNRIGDEHKFFGLLDQKFTYMFELIGPENRVVIPYETNEICFLGARNMETLEEVKPEDSLFDEIRKYFRIPKRFELKTFDDVKAAANAMSWDTEGFVVCDNYFNRVKIKSPEYVRAHFARNNGTMTHERLLDIILLGEKNEFLTYAADYKDALEKVEALYYEMLDEIHAAIAEIKPESFETRKDFALAVKTRPAWLQPFLFKYDTVEVFIKSLTAEKLVSYMKLKGVLE